MAAADEKRQHLNPHPVLARVVYLLRDAENLAYQCRVDGSSIFNEATVSRGPEQERTY